MARERLVELAPAGAVADVERRVEGEKPEEVAVRAVSGRRAGAAPANSPEVVAALDGRRRTLRQSADLGVDVRGQPVGERADRRVRVIDDESERAGAGRRVAPGQRRGRILTVAGMAARDRVAVAASVAG